MATGPLQFDRTRLLPTVDALAIALAVSLPWSTSATAILAVLWIVAVIPTLNWAEVRRCCLTPAGGLPVLLVLLGVLGMAWADVSLLERWRGLDSFLKLLVIPLLLVHFRRSDRGMWVLGGYLVSCVVLLLVSSAIYVVPALNFIPGRPENLLVKNGATQSGEFVTCIFGLLFLANEFFERRQWGWLTGALAIVLGMLANMFFVATGRTALVVIPVLLVLLAAKRLNAKGIALVFACAIAVGAVGWMSSPYLRERTIQLWTDYQSYEATDAKNSSSERIEFWRQSIEFVREAPIIGHGTGSIHALSERWTAGQIGPAATATANPHNQTFAVAIQLGFVGVAVLWAMWIAHLCLFRGGTLAEWIGLVVVAQNIVGSLFNSHLFDFTQGWVYVVGVGAAGGALLRHRAVESTAAGA